MSKLTPEERTSTERRLAEVAARMAELQPTLSSTIAPEWVDLYRERAQLEHRLKDDA
jgi:P2-related tail formation protein